MSFGKPFALLLPINALSDSGINNSLDGSDRQLQLLIPSRRMRFYNNSTGLTGNQPTFKAVYIGVDIFEKQIILEEMTITKLKKK